MIIIVTNTNLVAVELFPVGGTPLNGWKLGFIKSGAKAAQNDTWTVTNAKEILSIYCTLDATGGTETATLSGTTITLTSGTATVCSALIVFR